MPRVVAIEGIGNVEFDDSMDDAAISRAIETEILSQPGVARKVPGTVANIASARLSDAGQTSTPIRPYELTPDTPGFWGSMGSALNVPQSMEEIKHRLTPGPHWIPGYEQAAALADSKTPQEVWNKVDPTRLPMEQLGERNWTGAIGTVTPQIAASLAGSPAGGRVMGAVKRTVVPAARLTGAAAVGAASNLPFGLSSPIKGAIRAVSKSLKNRPPKPVVIPPETVTPVPEFPTGTDFPMRSSSSPVPSARLGGSEPVSTPERITLAKNWANEVNAAGRPPDLVPSRLLAVEPVYGDAPNQPIQPIRPRKVGPDFDPRSSGGKFAPVKSIPLKSDKRLPSERLSSAGRTELTMSEIVPPKYHGKIAPDVFEELSGRPHVFGQLSSAPERWEIMSRLPTGTRILTTGQEAMALLSPENKVIRIARKYDKTSNRPNIPEVLQPISSEQIGSWTIEYMPRVKTFNSNLHEAPISPIEVTALKDRLAAKGYDLWDAHSGNIGRTADGKLVVIDGGAIQPITSDAVNPTTARLPVRTKLPKDVSVDEVMTVARSAIETNKEAIADLKLTSSQLPKGLPKGQPVATTPSKSARRVTWTDKKGTSFSGTVSTPIKSKSGPAFIVKDETGKSRFVTADKLKDELD